MTLVELNFPNRKLFFALDMFTLSVFLNKNKIKLSDITAIVEDLLLLYELFYEATKRGMSRSQKEFDMDFEEFGSLLAENPDQFTVCFTKFESVMDKTAEALTPKKKKSSINKVSRSSVDKSSKGKK